MKMKSSVWLPIGLLIVFAITRWPGLLPQNFSAAYALLFCAGVYIPGRLAWWLPLATMMATDVVMNVSVYHVSPVGAYMLLNYATYAAVVAIGKAFSARSSWLKLVGGGLLGAVLFYLVTNTAAWLQNPGYTKSLAGWIQAMTTGIPNFPPTWMFFRNTLLSTGLFTGLFVGTMKLSEKAETEEEAAEPEEQPEGAQAEKSKA